MGQTVYIDLFFLINFSMDFLCLFLTAKLMSEKIHSGRYVLAASVGGVYACVALLLYIDGILAMAIDSFACIIISFIAFFESRRIRQIPLFALVFTATSMVLGGFMTALFNLFNRLKLSEIFGGDGNSEDSPSVWILLLLAVGGGIFTKLCGAFFRKRGLRKYANVEIFLEGRRIQLRAMADSGNLLREPLSSRPCIVADAKRLEGFFPREILSVMKDKCVAEIGKIPPKYARRICFIPTRTAVGEGMLLGLRTDRIVVETEKEKKEVDAVVVISELENSADGSDALIPNELLM